MKQLYLALIVLLLPCHSIAQNYYQLNNKETGMYIEQVAEFKGSLESYILKRKAHPLDDHNKPLRGIVCIGFTIADSGKVLNAYVHTSVHPLLDSNALNIVRLMPDWLPAKNNGKNVAWDYVLKIKYP